MNIPDVINGSYEFLGGIFMLLNCIKIYHDKKVKGISILSMAFFSSWAWWNIYYYPHLNQWISFIGGLLIALTNTIWFVMSIYYSRKCD